MYTSQLEGIFSDPELRAEIETLAAKQTLRRNGYTLRPEELPLRGGNEGPFVPTSLEGEAILLLQGRPSIIVQNGTFTPPKSGVWKKRFALSHTRLNQALRAVGRVELEGHPVFDWVGTAWLVAPDVVVTNTHVAREFARRQDARIAFAPGIDGKAMRARVDFLEEKGVRNQLEVHVKEVLFLADLDADAPDIALLKLDRAPILDGLPIQPIPLASTTRTDRDVVAIGYPAEDSRNAASAMANIFGETYDVKRLAPGRITALEGHRLYHDCSTLGGSSGSVLIDLETGEAVGVHFSGAYRKANSAVKVEVLREALALLDHHPRAEPERDPRAGIITPSMTRAPDTYQGKGYHPDFLGLPVPLPLLTREMERKTARIRQGPDKGDYVLSYTHFSVVMNAERKQAFFTATNIDGKSLRRVPRGRDTWIIDGRIAADEQTGEALYRNNDLDRGHLVRRLDPVWGDLDTATKANDDTFHFTNCTPQHQDLNQKIWNDLEDYILDNTDAHDLKVTVFTGPVFRDTDPLYRGVRIPEQFWKVVVMRRKDQNELAVAAYVQSQASLIDDLEFMFGRFGTWQVALTDVERMTGLDFGNLRDHDRFGRENTREGHSTRQPMNRTGDTVI